MYMAACEDTHIRHAAYETFCKLWRTLLPHITVMRPMTDLCDVCQQNATAFLRTINFPEEAKLEVCVEITLNSPVSIIHMY